MKDLSKKIEKISLLGINLNSMSLEDSVDYIRKLAKDKSGGYLCFINVHTITESQWNLGLAKALNGAVLGAIDGVPLIWLAKALGYHIGGRVAGPDFIMNLIHKEFSLAHGFIGGMPGVADKIIEILGVQGVSLCPPVREFSEKNVKEDLIGFFNKCDELKMNPTYIWVGLGAPKQELWIAEATRLYPSKLFFGIGAAFDFISGKKSRAPLWMQKMGLEWFYRLIQEPRRLAKRYFITNSAFVFFAVKEVMQKKLLGRR